VVICAKEQNKIHAELKVQTQQISTLKDNVQVQNDHLNDVNNTKKQLFKIIAHDLKNLLSSGFTGFDVCKHDVIVMMRIKLFFEFNKGNLLPRHLKF
jgi:hypothetical protein